MISLTMALLMSASVCLFSSCQYINGLLTPQKPECAVHSLGEWKITKQPSCGAGKEERACKNCDYKETKDIPGSGDFYAHTFDQNTLCTTCGHQEFIESDEYTGAAKYVDVATYESCIVTLWWNSSKTYALMLSLSGGAYQDPWYTIAGYEGTPVNVVLPKKFRNVAIESLGGPIGDKLDVSSYGFRECKTLEGIIIPENTTIHASSFYKCSALNKIVIKTPARNFSNIFTGTAFWKNYQGEVVYLDEFCLGPKEEAPAKVTIKEGTKKIVDYAFEENTSLTEVTIPKSLTTMGKNAFKDCTSLTKVTILDGVTSISVSAFQGCTSLTEITIPNSVTAIKTDAFSGCSSLKEITIPSSVTSIYNSAFLNCTSLTKVTLPDGITSIESYTFQGCSDLEEIVLPKSVTKIGYKAFTDCRSLKKVYINRRCTLDATSFKNCHPDIKFIYHD